MSKRSKTLGLRVPIQSPRLGGKASSWSDGDRASRHERGYGTAWDKLRLQILQRDCYICRCSECQPAGKTFPTRIRPATEVDHVIPKAKGGTDDPGNLAAINADCHRRKTLRDRGAQPKPKPRIAPDGWPIE